MKRIISLCLCIVILFFTLFLFPSTVNAATSGKTGDCTWTLDGTVLTISGNGEMGMYNLKTSTGEYCTNAPWGTNVTHVVIEDGVITIGQCSFAGCKNLRSASIASSVGRICKDAFRDTGLEAIILPESISIIQDGAFNECRQLRKIKLPKNVSWIGFNTFSYTSLTDVWYSGSKIDKSNILIETQYNSGLNSWIWHYNSCSIAAPHSFDPATQICTVCGTQFSKDMQFPTGDVDGDSVVSNTDVELLLWYTLYPEDYFLFTDADYDTSTSIDNLDVEYLLWHTLFPEEYPL